MTASGPRPVAGLSGKVLDSLHLAPELAGPEPRDGGACGSRWRAVGRCRTAFARARISGKSAKNTELSRARPALHATCRTPVRYRAGSGARTVHAEKRGDEGGVADRPGPRAELDRLAVGTQGGLVGCVKFRRDVEGFTSRRVRERVGARQVLREVDAGPPRGGNGRLGVARGDPERGLGLVAGAAAVAAVAGAAAECGAVGVVFLPPFDLLRGGVLVSGVRGGSRGGRVGGQRAPLPSRRPPRGRAPLPSRRPPRGRGLLGGHSSSPSRRPPRGRAPLPSRRPPRGRAPLPSLLLLLGGRSLWALPPPSRQPRLPPRRRRASPRRHPRPSRCRV